MFSNALKSFTSNISSNYILSPSPVSHSGPWKIHDAKKKKTNQSVSVWVFERKSLDPGGGNLSLRGSNSRDGLKAAQDEVVERLKKEASLLARLRHPCVLELVEPVEDTRGGGLMFATEQVMCSLGVLLAEKDEEEGRGAGARRRREVDIDELEIQKGLLQIGKALEFLHESAALVHGNLTPEAVVINAKSDWKLTSLSFTISSISPPLPPAFDPRLPPFVQHSLDYSAPDLTLDSTLTPSSDLFSLGLLIIALYNHPHRSPLETHNSPSTYRRLLTSASTTPSPHNNYLSTRPLPRPLLDSLLPTLLTRHPSTRCTAREFQQSPYFDNILVSALRFLDALPAKTPSEKASFMRGLPKILPQFPRGVLEKKVLPGLVEELRDDTMLALILPNIFIIASQGSARLFQDRVLTRLKEVFIAPASTTEAKTAAAKIAEREKEAGREGGLTVVLSHLSVIMEKTTAREFKDDILPIYQLALESSTHALQDLALRSLGGILPKLDFPTLKGEVFPVVAGVFTKTSSLGIKIRGLEAFKVLCGGMVDEKDAYAKQRAVRKEECPVLDKYTIQEKVVPLLKGIKTKEPAVMMAALEVFAQVGGLCDREVVAMELLPGLWTMSFGPLLGLSQFQAFMSTIKSLSAKIEQEQTRKLQELGTTTTPANTDILSFGGTPGPRPMSTSNDTEFENLVFGKPTSAPANGWGTPPPQKKPETPAFSWSTPAVSGRIGSLSPPPQRQSRAVTPDVNLSTFTPMTPGTPGSPGMGGMNMAALNLQPSAGFGSTTALRPTPQQPATIDWSSALTPSKPTFTSPPLSTPSFTALTPNKPTFTPPPLNTPSFTTLTPKPAPGYNYNQNKTNGGTTQESHPTILYGQTRHQAAPTGSGAFAGFMIPPPPGGGMNLVIGSKKEEKKGLDQWESLL